MWFVECSVFPKDEEERLIRCLDEVGLPHRELTGSDLRCGLPRLSALDVLRGSCWFISEASRTTSWHRELWGSRSSFDYSRPAVRHPQWLLNDHFELLSFHELCWKREAIAAGFAGSPDRIFVRPDDGFKTFEGGLIKIDEFDDWIERCRLLQIPGATKVIVSPPKNIDAEWRCFILDGEVIGGSQYKPTSVRNLPSAVRRFALDVDDSTNRPCRAYAMDVAATDQGWRVVEIGCLCCVAFYEADIGSIVERLDAICQP